MTTDRRFASLLRSHLDGLVQTAGDMVDVQALSSRPLDAAGAGPALLSASCARRCSSLAIAIDLAMQDDLIVQRPQGLYCPPGDFYIDPWRKVERAVITHAHADHARPGHAHYLATAVSEGLLRSRLGQGITLQGAGLRRGRGAPRRAHFAAPGRPRAGLGPGAGGARRARVGGQWRLPHHAGRRHDPTAPAHPSSRCAATPSSPSPPSACPSTAGGPTPSCSARSTSGGPTTPQPGAPACWCATAWARRSASWAVSMRPSAPSSATARWSRSTALTARRAWPCPTRRW